MANSLRAFKTDTINLFLASFVFLIVFAYPVIAENISPIAHISPEVGFASYSNGLSGASIPASCESGYSHQAECGYGWGAIFVPPVYAPPVYVPPVYVPPPPPPQCFCNSAPNSCGMTNPGFGDCGSACPVPPPLDNLCQAPVSSFKSLNTDSDGVVIGGDSGLGAGGGSDIMSPGDSRIVNKGNRCRISWSASPATSCTLKGPGINEPGNQVSPPAITGVVKTPRIGIDTIGSSVYILTCYNGSVVSAQSKFTCKMNPEYSETL